MIPRGFQRRTQAPWTLVKASHASSRQKSLAVKRKSSPVNSILIANRGEIALRVSRTANDLGIRTTTVFTDPDAQSQHTLASPFSVNLGTPTAYLDGNKIIKIAKEQGCDAVHPGYGFLSENAGFAKQCEEAELNFIGPPWDAIESMGDKSRSKEIMLAANVPCTPGYHGANQDALFLRDQAAQIGYPVLLKAVHGGGGKGMRIAEAPDSFLTQLESAKSEARNSFGNDIMLVEKYITRPRHVEVQIFGDKHGDVVALGERDCSIQRRHQKIIEESPAPGLSDAQRKDLWGKAVQAGHAVGYVGAGTVEFILDSESGGFYFMEMNTRLQVEHPVTEMCTGLDLVEWQVRVARGEPLPLTQAEIERRILQRGHAMEARIYAEDPDMEFLPTAGTLTHLRLPQERPESVRIDTAIRGAPTTISSHYDPMISKLIVRGADRETAVKKLRIALEEYEVAGLKTNIEFLKRLCLNNYFIHDTAELDTGFIKKNHDELFTPTATEPEVWVQAALGLMLKKSSAYDDRYTQTKKLGFGDQLSQTLGFQSRSFEFDLSRSPAIASLQSSSPVRVDIKQITTDTFSATVFVEGGADTEAQAVTYPTITAAPAEDNSSSSCTLSTLFPHTRLTSTIVFPLPWQTAGEYKPAITLFDRGRRHDLTIPPPAWLNKALGKSPASANEASVTAPMPSKILRVETAQGDRIIKDQPLVVVESMKMEMVIRAPRDGLLVKKVVFKPGEICKAGAVLIEFEDETVTSGAAGTDIPAE